VNRIRATEPSEGMREVFAKNTSDPRVTIEEGYFDSSKVETGWADLAIVAQVCIIALHPRESLGVGLV